MTTKLKSNAEAVKVIPSFHKLRPDLRDTLAKALKLGNLSIMPPRNNGSKRPCTGEWKQYQKEKATRKQLTEWYNRSLTGFGLVCGAISDNLECLDFDDREIYKQFCQRMRDEGLSDLLNRLRNGYSEYSPNGVHFLYRCSEISGNMKLATRPKGETE